MKENQRVRLTKMMLKNSLTALLNEKSIHKISVRELCDHAGINRTTFYKYYASQYELMQDIESTVLAQIESAIQVDKPQETQSVESLTRVMTLLEDNVELCRILIENSVDSEFPTRLLQLSKIHQLIGAKLKNEFDEINAEYAYRFIVNVGYSIIREWISKDERESPSRMAEILMNIISRLGQ